ncbi:tRNA 2-thiocytidine(32) synthetase TtcA [Accumulibacter sp.]|uniref:tRNA 2-thiocytidine(32) synthetase TtcA n=1 Tax=Accumulibacter sp. TaxID=2053492 RepID=UPI0025E69F50|nr:tRNA 2-thiocytidine(32) synthetase TtcA [Accumulibacter sp.]MCM8595325.1 tRNA 2-thiocytidine(32) synthetase TtcA [Accumulibacter sp.]MDS4049472.1 tRNA 2-thiocytidine(32) synthetase TtcA [Accumulibacter sp.]
MELSNTLKRLRKQLIGKVGRAIADYRMIEAGDTVLVCLSGGKDSHTLLSLLMSLQQRAPVEFRLIAMNLDQKQPGFPTDVLPRYLAGLGIDYHIVEQDTYTVVRDRIPPGKTSCSLCSRLRRGIIYRAAKELGANKIALGHHRDDIVHTLFLNLFFAGQLKAMPPKLLTDDGAHVLIRPLAYCSESDIARFARGMDFPIIPCSLCGAQGEFQRQKVREMMADWDRRFPGRTESVLSALQKVVPSHLADNNFFDFRGLRPGTVAADETAADSFAVWPGLTQSRSTSAAPGLVAVVGPQGIDLGSRVE